MDLHLVGAATCPFTQRALIALGEKQAGFTLSVIDPGDRPEWFLALSPRGEVPLLVADGTPIFEAQPICEFVDEVLPGPPLLTTDPYARARDRAWFQYADVALLHPMFGMLFGSGEAEVVASCDAFEAGLARVQDEMAGQDWLSGDGRRFGLADLAMAPVFTRISLLETLGSYEFPRDRLPGAVAWRERLAERPSVSRSVLDGFVDGMRAMMRRAGALLIPVE